MSNKLEYLSIAGALAGAVALAASTVPTSAADFSGMEQCFGISDAGQNSCAAAGHVCAGQSTVAYSGEEFRIVKEGTCTELGGKLQAFQGVNDAAMMKKG